MHGEGLTGFFIIIYISEVDAPFRSDIEYRLYFRRRAVRCARATIDTVRKKSSRAKVYIRARSEEMREERARYHAAEGKGREGKGSGCCLRNPPTRAPLRRKVKAPVKDVRSVCRNARDMFPR